MELDRLDVFRTGTFGSVTFGERDFLAFVKVVKADSLYGRRVEKQIFSSAYLDESESLVSQLLNCAVGHFVLPRLLLQKRVGNSPGRLY
jgi:hypothetical protein